MFRVVWTYHGHESFTTFGDEVSARAFADSLRKRGVKTVSVRKL